MKKHPVLRASTCAVAAILIVLMIPLLFLACGGGSPTEPKTQTSESSSGASSASSASGAAVAGGIDIEKSTNGEDADDGPGPSLLEGDAVEWTYEVTNTGDVALTGVEVTDDQGVVVSCPATSLQPGESMTCTASGNAVEGSYENIGTAVGKLQSDGSDVEDSDASHYTGTSLQGGIDIEKSTNGEDADDGPGPSLLEGDAVEWTYEVTNTGDVALTEVVVTDDQGVVVSCPATSLQPGESMTCTASGNAVEGPYENIGTAVGKLQSDGSDVEDSDPSHYTASEDEDSDDDSDTDSDDDSDDDKVAICHIPPGNPSNRKVIEVGASAVNAHLAHGDNVYEEIEVCSDGVDNNCDGQVDEGCAP